MFYVVNQWERFKHLLKSSYKDLLPIIIVMLIFQIGVLETVPHDWQRTIVGLIIVGIGLSLFLHGLELAIFPLGEGIAQTLASKESRSLLLLFAFLVGYGSTVAEPALSVIAHKAMIISDGRIDDFMLRQVVALSVGFAVVLGVVRIILQHAIHYYIIGGYSIALAITYFAPREMIGLSYDLGGVTTSTVTVPLVAALGIGIAASVKSKNLIIDSFGLIAFASLTPLIFVQIYGIYAYEFSSLSLPIEQPINAAISVDDTPKNAVASILQSVIDVAPVLSVVLFFQIVILRAKIAHLSSLIIGLLLTIIGLACFVIGLEMGLFALGESMAKQLVMSNNPLLIYIFGFAIGFSTTLAEPTLIVIAKKAQEVSGGRIHDTILRFFVALGVAIGITLGCYRIVQGDAIHYYLIAGYMVVIILTYLAPRYIIPIAYDSGGVTTSTITVPLVAALGIGLSEATIGRDPMIDGFGLIAFASLFPMLSVLIYGIVASKLSPHLSHIIKLSPTNSAPSSNIAQKQATRNLPHLNHYVAVFAITNPDKREDVIAKAHENGAGGVTIFDARGFHPDVFENYYRQLPDMDHKMLLFIVPEKIADRVIHSISDQLDLEEMSDNKCGIVFSVEITKLIGFSSRQEALYTNIVEKIESLKPAK